MVPTHRNLASILRETTNTAARFGIFAPEIANIFLPAKCFGPIAKGKTTTKSEVERKFPGKVGRFPFLLMNRILRRNIVSLGHKKVSQRYQNWTPHALHELYLNPAIRYGLEAWVNDSCHLRPVPDKCASLAAIRTTEREKESQPLLSWAAA